ncbi:ribosomal silencing factor RsfS [Deltaproteobacteria bacterium]|nr:ribosomal silencing factor RsfS [Deltaproteobacteria bacterium]
MTDKTHYATPPATEKIRRMANWAAEKKGRDIFGLDLISHNTFTDGILLITAGSIRHAQGLADYILQMSREAQFEFLRMEGYQNGQWILLDMNDVVISIFQKETRDLYRIEDLWKTAPVIPLS